MSNTYTAIIKQDGAGWMGWIEEVPGTNCQESTRDDLLETMRITLQEALDVAGADYEEEPPAQ